MLRKFPFHAFIFLSFWLASCQKEVLISDQDYKVLGDAATKLLSGSNYSSLVIEVSFMPGLEPDDSSINHLLQFLKTYLNKPGGIRVVPRQISRYPKDILTLTDLVQLEKKHRTFFSLGNTMAVHILIVDANYSEEELLGISYWNTSFCLFGKKIIERSGALGQITRATLTTTLLEHEFGHLLGLVGQGSPMQTTHRDPSKGAHCINRNCLMYHGIETAESNSNTRSIPSLDAACKADLRANGGR